MKGALLVNLGTPNAPTPRAVGEYLLEFLSDPRVVDLPRWLWIPLLKLVIVPLRRRRSAEAYSKVWTDEGSPLLVGSRKLCERLQESIEGVAVELAMRYGEPSVRNGLDLLRDKGVDELVIVPMYPQFSDTTTRTVMDAVDEALRQMDWFPVLHTIEKYHDEQAWVDAVANSIRDFRRTHGSADKLLFSLHGIPQRYADAGDPYQKQCIESVNDIAAALELNTDQYQLAFQSRVGREPWLKPYTDFTLRDWAKDGIRHVQVVCPGFSIDCLETLEEIAMENAELFEENGGERLQYIPALNDSAPHVALYESLIHRCFEKPD
ncbi:MAG: ferrochelatase [Xanthomonadales bacterium]|nr:ferrochelatase [Gammaproteobacteria bacterium]NNE05734.1 ferrochelatase [Xanthomonadales bacterium]NNL96264.1 ferrochelatase [Xanthomonadales bacterium]